MPSKSEKKRELILVKAEQIFIRMGYNGVTMKDIIDECEISRGGLYVYFSSVDEIFKEVVKEHNKLKIDTIKAAIEKGKTFTELVEDYFTRQKKRLLNMNGSLKAAMMEFFLTHKDEYSQSFIFSQFDNSRSMMFEILRHGASKEVTDSYLKTMAENIMFFIEGISTIALLAGLTEEQIDNQFQYIKQIIISNIKNSI